MEDSSDTDIYPKNRSFKDLSPEGYGLKAVNVPPGFVAVGTNNETWISMWGKNEKQRWIRTIDVDDAFISDDGTPAKHESPENKTKKRKSLIKEDITVSRKSRKASGQSKAGYIKSKSGLLWIGDPVDLFIYAQKHSLDYFLKQINKSEASKKKICTAARGLTWTSIETDKSKPIYCGDESICIKLSK
jgi:hypothetical protein